MNCRNRGNNEKIGLSRGVFKETGAEKVYGTFTGTAYALMDAMSPATESTKRGEKTEEKNEEKGGGKTEEAGDRTGGKGSKRKGRKAKGEAPAERKEGAPPDEARERIKEAVDEHYSEYAAHYAAALSSSDEILYPAPEIVEHPAFHNIFARCIPYAIAQEQAAIAESREFDWHNLGMWENVFGSMLDAGTMEEDELQIICPRLPREAQRELQDYESLNYPHPATKLEYAREVYAHLPRLLRQNLKNLEEGKAADDGWFEKNWLNNPKTATPAVLMAYENYANAYEQFKRFQITPEVWVGTPEKPGLRQQRLSALTQAVEAQIQSAEARLAYWEAPGRFDPVLAAEAGSATSTASGGEIASTDDHITAESLLANQINMAFRGKTSAEEALKKLRGELLLPAQKDRDRAFTDFEALQKSTKPAVLGALAAGMGLPAPSTPEVYEQNKQKITYLVNTIIWYDNAKKLESERNRYFLSPTGTV